MPGSRSARRDGDFSNGAERRGRGYRKRIVTSSTSDRRLRSRPRHGLRGAQAYSDRAIPSCFGSNVRNRSREATRDLDPAERLVDRRSHELTPAMPESRASGCWPGPRRRHQGGGPSLSSPSPRTPEGVGVRDRQANMFRILAWVGGRYSMDSAIGRRRCSRSSDNFRAWLDGFHQMDEHFRTAPFERTCRARWLADGVVHGFLRSPRRASALEQYLSASRLPAAAHDGEQRQHVTREGRESNYPTGPSTGRTTNGQHSIRPVIHQGPVYPVTHRLSHALNRSAAHDFCWRTCRTDRGVGLRQDARRSRPGHAGQPVPHRTFQGISLEHDPGRALTPETLASLSRSTSTGFQPRRYLESTRSISGGRAGQGAGPAVIPELESQTEPKLGHDSSTNKPDPALSEEQATSDPDGQQRAAAEDEDPSRVHRGAGPERW